MQRSALCRSRQELSNAYLLAKFGFDTAENEPAKNSQKLQIQAAPAGALPLSVCAALSTARQNVFGAAFAILLPGIYLVSLKYFNLSITVIRIHLFWRALAFLRNFDTSPCNFRHNMNM